MMTSKAPSKVSIRTAVNDIEAIIRRKIKFEKRFGDEDIKENFIVRHCAN
jgi:hypothetical protein